METLINTGFDVRPGQLPWNSDLDRWASVIRDLVHGEMAQAHGDWFRDHTGLYRPRTRQAVELGQSVTDGRLAQCRRERETVTHLVEQAMDRAGVDCWICPATGTVAPIGYENTGDSWLTSFWSFLGWPCITVPVFDGPDGLPWGLQCIAPAGHDEELLACAANLEGLF